MSKLKDVAKWEYACLNRDLELQGDDVLNIDFDEWYKTIFLIEEGWQEIRESMKYE